MGASCCVIVRLVLVASSRLASDAEPLLSTTNHKITLTELYTSQDGLSMLNLLSRIQNSGLQSFERYNFLTIIG